MIYMTGDTQRDFSRILTGFDEELWNVTVDEVLVRQAG